MTRPLALLALVVALATAVLAPGGALAGNSKPTLGELEGEVMCPTCKTTLDMSTSPVAERIRSFIRERIAAGDTKGEIKQALVDEFGANILAEPSKQGFNLLAWVLPLGGIAAAALVLGGLAWRWSRRRTPGGGAAEGAEGADGPADGGLDPDSERRLDEELARYED